MATTSRFEELREVQQAAWSALRDYRQECLKFFDDFRSGFIDFLGCDGKLVRAFPLDNHEKGHDKEKDYPVTQAIKAGEDSFWSIGVSVELHENNTIEIPVRFKKLDGVFTLKVASPPEATFEYATGSPLNFDACYEEIFRRIKEFYSNRLTRYLRGSVRRPIGFDLRY